MRKKLVLILILSLMFSYTFNLIINAEQLIEHSINGMLLNNKNSVEIYIDVPEDGEYNITFEYLNENNNYSDAFFDLIINDEYKIEDLYLPLLLESQQYPFDKDKKGNEITPETFVKKDFTKTFLRKNSTNTTEGLNVNLKKGKNKLKFNGTLGSIYIKNVEAIKVSVPTYNEYLKNYENNEITEKFITLEAERIFYKNSGTIRPISARDIEAVPYNSNLFTMSYIGQETWQNNGDAIYYKLNIEETGFYKIAFKYKQDLKDNTITYRTITIDGQIPFQEAKNIPFYPTSNWEIKTLQKDEEFLFYLDKGEHILGIEADSSQFVPISNEIKNITDKVNEIALEVKKITGNSIDVNRDWDILSYIPTLEQDLLNIVNSLDNQYNTLINLNNGNDKTKELINIKIAKEQVSKIAEKPNNIPKFLNIFSEGSGSVSQMLGDISESLLSQPLSLDQIYIYNGNPQFPDYHKSIFKKFYEGTKYFLASFNNTEEEKGEITVWVNRARNYIDLMQKMSDEQFTPKTGIKINFSIMPNESKLILANTTNTQPDVALGVSAHLPYDLAIRNAVYNLRNFEDFNEVAKQFSSGAFITHTFEDGIYALPETQDFYVLFYRKDLLEKLNIPIPNTWEEVVQILPELQRYGMNFYAPLSSSNSFKNFSLTLPFFYQYGTELYSEDGMKVTINSEEGLEAMKLMTDLYTIYGVPSQVANFYQQFRNGTLPIGVSTFETYLKLDTVAAELKGKWDIVEMPGVIDENGYINRAATGPGQTGVIFSKSNKIDESWEFMKWWFSADVQAEFGTQLKLLYGDEYIYNTANLEAFSKLPIDEEHKKIILKQWEHLYEVPKTPASYMVEREISNAWNKIVYDGENIRGAVDDAVILMNQEIAIKMEEFGYMKDGKIIKPYPIPTREKIEGWVNDNEKD